MTVSSLDDRVVVPVDEQLLDRSDMFCVIGAGPSGLATLKNFSQAGIPVEGFEASADLGGVWNFAQPSGSVYESTHLISSKRLTEFRDWPMPAEFPEYPSHVQALDYLRSYAEHFELLPLIQFSTRVNRVEKSATHWSVHLNDGTTRRYRGVVIANGHHRVPNMPEIPGEIGGEFIHSHDYKSAAQLRGKRVLVIGAGNSGADIAVDAAQQAASCTLSMRRGYHIVPKFLRGYPTDQWGELLLRWRVPLFLRRLILARGTYTGLGRPQSFGLPRPDHRFLETHPLVNSQLMYYAAHGRIQPKPAVAEFRGAEVVFSDGSRAVFDLVIVATGYQIDFPFIARELLNWREGLPRLYLHAFHPHDDSLFVAGMIQPDSGQWGLTDWQARLMTQYIHAREVGRAAWFEELKTGPQPSLSNGITYKNSARHQLEVEHYSYRRRLQKLSARFERESRNQLVKV
jgi:NADPH-dependent 2,4-dienoyl-CoA reductase/sulfur reductase-like enzyme